MCDRPWSVLLPPLRSARRRALPFLLLAVSACGSPEGELVGRWRSADGPVLDFQKDGTVTIGKRIPMGAKYSIPEDGKLQLEQELIGPVTMPLEMMGDSFRVEGQGILGKGPVTYFRDDPAQVATTYALAGTPTQTGRCEETGREYVSLQTVRKEVPLEAAFVGGELTLDPLTHSFTQQLRMELRDDRRGSGMSPSVTGAGGSFRGRYTEDGGRITLQYQDARTIEQVQGRIENGRVVLPGADYLRLFTSREGQGSQYGLFHVEIGLGGHQVSWGSAPELSFEPAAAPAR